jgi:hypothetical protein
VRVTRHHIFSAAIALAAWASASSASAQTVVNLTNLDPTATGYGALRTVTVNASTSLDLLNRTTALSNGGLFPGAVSNHSQTAYNQINTIGINANGSVSPIVLGNQTPVVGMPNMVEINTITSAYIATGTLATVTGTSSATINNINAAISSAVNPIVGASAAVNGPWLGGYGGTASGAALTANQIGVNTINGVGAAVADGTSVALSQLPGAAVMPAGSTTYGNTTGTGPTVIQGGSLNLSTINTLLAYSPAGSVSINDNNGISITGEPVRGNQTAVNTFNASTLVGTNISAGVQQLADGLNSTQTALASVNRAFAYSLGSQVSSIAPSVTNLNQTASVALNALNLQSGSAATNATLSGMQSTGYNTLTGGVLTGTGTTAGAVPIAVATNQIVAFAVGAVVNRAGAFTTTALTPSFFLR